MPLPQTDELRKTCHARVVIDGDDDDDDDASSHVP
jgi:hypothetical protein